MQCVYILFDTISAITAPSREIGIKVAISYVFESPTKPKQICINALSVRMSMYECEWI